MRLAGAIMLLLLLSCQSRHERDPEAIARVDESYLYDDEIKGLVPAGTSKEDSVVIVRNFIDRWAAQKLLMQRAEMNLNDAQKERISSEYSENLEKYIKGWTEESILELRQKVHRRYRIIYRIEGQTIRIVRILHGARDYERLLLKGE